MLSPGEFGGDAEFKPFFIHRCSKTLLHKFMEHDVIVFRVKMQDQEPREEAADAP